MEDVVECNMKESFHKFEDNSSFAQTKKALFRRAFLVCGVGGVRTLVQTTSFQAFYMLSSLVGFRYAAGQEHPTRILRFFSFMLR